MNKERRVKFGLNATNMNTYWPEYRKFAVEAEAMGYDSFWVFDHVIPGPVNHDGPALECFTTLAAVAAVTNRIEIGSLVLAVQWRNPAMVAKMGAMIDHISGGRFTLGYGPGYDAFEHDMYDVRLGTPGERIRRMDEALEIVKRMWTQEKADFAGRYYTIRGAVADPRPTQQPHPPLLVAGRGEHALRVVARQADIHNASSNVEGLRQLYQALERNCREIGRNPAEIERSAIVLHSFSNTPEREQAKQDALSKLFNRPFDQMADRVLSGSPEHIAGQIQRYVDAGVTHFMMTVLAPYDLDGLKWFAEQVLPRFR